MSAKRSTKKLYGFKTKRSRVSKPVKPQSLFRLHSRCVNSLFTYLHSPWHKWHFIPMCVLFKTLVAFPPSFLFKRNYAIFHSVSLINNKPILIQILKKKKDVVESRPFCCRHSNSPYVFPLSLRLALPLSFLI